MSAHDPYAAFRIPAYREFLLGALLAQIGTAAQSVAIGWEMYRRTGSALALGMVGLVQAIPMLLFTLPAGYLADVADRRKVVVASMLGTTLSSLGLALLSARHGSIHAMYALLFLDSLFLRLGWPARSALLPQLVPSAVFENAVTWRTSSMQISAMVGPALGGFIIASSLPSAYLVAAACTAVNVVLIARLDVPPTVRRAGGRMLAQVAEGIRFVRRNELILGAISLDLFAVLLGGATYLLPIYADRLGVGARGLGTLRAAPAVGALGMAVLLAHLPPMQRAGRTLFTCVAGFGVATILFGVSRQFWPSIAMLLLTGAFDNVSMVIRGTLVQLHTPDEMRGRVSAVNAIFIGASNELGGFESGTVAQVFGPVPSVVSGGIGTLIVVVTWLLAFPALRRAGPLAGPAPEPTVEH